MQKKKESKEITQKMVMNKSAWQIAWSHHLGLEYLMVDNNNNNGHVLKSYYVLGPGLAT